MCGISGVQRFDDQEVDRQLFCEMVNAQSHRGPDNTGYFFVPQFAMAHNRLSIMDLRDVANQPMTSSCGRYTIVYNGEVYNFRDLRSRMESIGVTFQTESDTEVVLLSFIHFGVSSFNMLNGMFAFCIRDNTTNTSYLVRDRYGIKPLYISQTSGELIFSSELGALLKYYKGNVTASKSSITEYMWYGTPLDGNTVYEEIKELSPGSWLEVSGDVIQEFTYYKYQIRANITSATEKHTAKLIQEQLRQAVHRQLESDVPLGVFLSGGVDSTAIVAFASEKIDRLKTYSVSFDYSPDGSELAAAARTAKQFNTEHHELRITGTNILDCIERLNVHHAQPFADAANIPLYLMTEAVKDDLKVVLQGDGGDELFGGYSIYKTFQERSRWKLLKWLPSLVNYLDLSHPQIMRLDRFVTAINSSCPHLVNARLLTMDTERNSPMQLLSDELVSCLGGTDPFAYFSKLYSQYPSDLDGLDKVLLTDLFVQLKEVFLEKVDRSTMANSVEVRVPFLDNDLVDLALQISARHKVKGGEQKYLLKRALVGVVPDHILFAKKKGFGVPYGQWLRRELREAFLDNLNSNAARELLNVELVLRRFRDHCNGKGYYGFQLWKIFILMTCVNKDKRLGQSLMELVA